MSFTVEMTALRVCVKPEPGYSILVLEIFC